MPKPSEIYWFLEAEYDTVRAWVEKNEIHRAEMKRLHPGVETPKVFFSFENFYETEDGE